MQLCARPSRQLDSEFTMRPWIWILPFPQSIEHPNNGLATWSLIMRPPNLLSLAPMCPLDPWKPGSLQTVIPPFQPITAPQRHRDTSLTQIPLNGCLSTLQTRGHWSPFSPWIYFSFMSMWPAFCTLFILGGVLLLRRKWHHALGDETVQWFEDFVLKLRAGKENEGWDCIVGETQAWRTMETLSEILQLKESCSILKGEVEVLKQEAKQCSERQAQLHEVERFFIQMKVFLEVSALQRVMPVHPPRIA